MTRTRSGKMVTCIDVAVLGSQCRIAGNSYSTESNLTRYLEVVFWSILTGWGYKVYGTNVKKKIWNNVGRAHRVMYCSYRSPISIRELYLPLPSTLGPKGPIPEPVGPVDVCPSLLLNIFADISPLPLPTLVLSTLFSIPYLILAPVLIVISFHRILAWHYVLNSELFFVKFEIRPNLVDTS